MRFYRRSGHWPALVLTLSLEVLQGCTPERLTDSAGKSPDANQSPGVVELHFEAENITFRELDKNLETNAFGKVHAMPKAIRSKIDLQIYEDGTSDWKIRKLDPKHNTKVLDLTPPNPMPQTRTTRIDRSGMGYFYGDDGKLLHKHQVPVQLFSDLVKQVRKNPDAVYGALGVKTKQQIDEVVANAKVNGAVVKVLNSKSISVSTSVNNQPSIAIDNARVVASDYKAVDIINTDLNIVMGSSLYNKNEDLVSQVHYRYKVNGEKKLVLTRILTK
jgi:hypothetical protein